MSLDGRVRAWEASAPGRGGVSIIDLESSDPADLDQILESVAGTGPFDATSLHHRRLADIDDGVVARITLNHAQLMPHGGPAVVRRLASALSGHGVQWCSRPPSGTRPEALDRTDAAEIDAVTRAASPAAIPLLLRQASGPSTGSTPPSQEESAVGKRLNRLLTPAIVACIGAPNAGKSSLLNALHRSSAAIVSASPGTTRDRVSAMLDLDGIVIEWLDMPGLRKSEDPIEQAAIDAGLIAIREATLVIHLTAPDVADAEFPEELRPAEGVLTVRNKIDLLDRSDPVGLPEDHLGISARSGEGIVELAQAIRRRIVRDADLNFDGRWHFESE